MLRVRRALPLARPRLLRDATVGATALAVLAGALVTVPVTWPIGLVPGAILIVAGLLVRRDLWLVLGAFALASALGSQAWAAAGPAPPGPFEGVVTLRTDPAPLGPGVVAEATADGQRVLLQAFGGSARRLRARLAGERLVIEGRLRPPSASQAARLRARHIVGVLEVAEVVATREGTALARSTNRVRRILVEGSRTLGPRDQSLYLGFVIGDDRAHPRALVEQFRASGLSHLSAVSGQNVAFVLAVASPGLRRLSARPRWLATLGLIAWFATLTRFEPSVLRASAMAALAATAVVAGRPTRPLRTLGLTVTIVLLLDPLLVHSVGWWLSVGATAGIALLARPLAARLPGPESVRNAIAITAAAQLGVAPVSIAVFGPMPLASVPANLLAGPAAAPVMVYGLPSGLAAALAPDPVATVIQWPTMVLVRWIGGVAGWAASWPLPDIGLPALLVLVIPLAWLLRRPARHRR